MLVLPFLSSALFALAFPNSRAAFLAWFALIPLIVFVFKGTYPRRFFWGWLSGTLAYGAILFWLLPTFRAAGQPTGLGIFCLIALSSYLGLYWGAWTWFLGRLSPLTPVRTTLVGAAAWTALEFCRTHLFSGFPWVLVGDSQFRALPFIQVASITGVYGVSFVVLLINIALACGRRALQVALTIGLATFLFGVHRLHAFAEERKTPDIRVALLQGNIDQYKKWDAAYVSEIEQSYQSLSAQASIAHPDLILWPETSVPGYPLQEAPLRRWLNGVVVKSATTHVVGAPLMKGTLAYNSAFVIAPNGDMTGEYDKEHLVPFGEIVPWANVLGRFVHVLNELGGFAAGENSPVLTTVPLRLGISICYEAIFPDLVRRSVRGGAEALANLTNDGWYMRTAEPWQHFMPNVLRAVENNRWLMRADNTGISGIVDPVGHIVTASSIFDSEVVTGTVHARHTQTFYSRHGDVFSWACVVVALLGLV